MTLFRIFLVAILLGILGYTLPVIAHHGMDLLTVFFGDIAKMDWPGQFNLDFSSFLLMTMLWVAWRSGFSLSGLLLAILVPVGGGMFTSLYVLLLTFQHQGDIAAVLLGSKRAAALRG